MNPQVVCVAGMSGSLWVFGVLLLFLLFRYDTPDRNPFQVARFYRAVVLILTCAIFLLAYKSVIWNRDLRALIVESCR